MAEPDAVPQSPGAAPWECRLQSLVLFCNALPFLPTGVVMGYAFLVLGVIIGPISWVLGLFLVALILGYAGLCLVTAGGLFRQKRRARVPALIAFLFFLSLYAAGAMSKIHQTPSTPAHVPVTPTVSHLPPWLPVGARDVLVLIRLLPLINLVALAHLLLRWKAFSQSGRPKAG